MGRWVGRKVGSSVTAGDGVWAGRGVGRRVLRLVPTVLRRVSTGAAMGAPRVGMRVVVGWAGGGPWGWPAGDSMVGRGVGMRVTVGKADGRALA